MMDYHLLPQFRPARLQDLVLWYEPWSFRGRTWRNLAPCYSDRNHGIAYGGVGLSTWHPLFAPAPEFDGVNAYVEAPDDDSLDITNLSTIESWAKIYDADGDIAPNQHWVTKGTGAPSDAEDNAYMFFIVNAGGAGDDYVRFSLSDGTDVYKTYSTSALKMSSFASNLYYHLVATWDGTTMKIYKNGVHASGADKSFSGSINSLSADLIIGRLGDGTRFFHGPIPLVRIYKAALTPVEIMHNYTHHPLYYLQRGIDLYMFVKKGGIYVP